MTKMFPTKSRLQVALCVDCLVRSLAHASRELYMAGKRGNYDKEKYLAALVAALEFRLRFLTRAILFQPFRSVYVPALPNSIAQCVRGRAREFRL